MREMNINHIAIIMDGNGRWASKNGATKAEGHSAGAISAKNIIEIARNHGIKHLTLYAFSSENWNRTKKEVSDIMELMAHYLTNEVHLLAENNIRLQIIGDKTKLSTEMQQSIRQAEKLTKDNDALNLYVAISYGGKDEIIRATQNLIKQGIQAEDVTEDLIRQNFDASSMPDVDLVIRTSGEKRLSNFLIWQTAYSELYFSDKLWPDFDEEEFLKAIEEFKTRKRNFGYAREQIK